MAATTGDSEAISSRDRRAASEAMCAVNVAAGMFEVYNADDEVHTVDLRQRACECQDYQFRQPDGGCKHLRRVLMLLGESELPADVTPDPTLVKRRERTQ